VTDLGVVFDSDGEGNATHHYLLTYRQANREARDGFIPGSEMEDIDFDDSTFGMDPVGRSGRQRHARTHARIGP
jgi:hypothetical protein